METYCNKSTDLFRLKVSSPLPRCNGPVHVYLHNCMRVIFHTVTCTPPPPPIRMGDDGSYVYFARELLQQYFHDSRPLQKKKKFVRSKLQLFNTQRTLYIAPSYIDF